MLCFNGKSFLSASLIVLFITVLACQVSAQANQRQIKLNLGQKSEVIIAPNESTKAVNFVFFSAKKSVSTLAVTLSAPKNSKLSVKSLGVSNSSTLEAAVAKDKLMYKLNLAAPGGKMKSSLIVGKDITQGGIGNNNGGPGGYRMMCNGDASSQYIESMVEDFKEKCLRSPRSEQDLCDGLFKTDAGYDCKVDPGEGSGGGGDFTNGGSGGSTTLPTLTAKTHVFKDACSSAKYLVVLSVDLTKVSSTLKSSGYKLTLDVVETELGDNPAATIKFGDGKYKTWIALAPLVSYVNKHGYQTWSSSRSAKRLLSNKIEPIKKSYNGFGVSIAVKHLKGGGPMTIAVFDSDKSYGLCVKRALRRQCLYGYKGGDC